ncbi:hypothetical protein SLE2022_373070 [Rubroshorea leprosula]
MCMRPEFTFLTLVIAGPKSPSKNIDVFLRPLIEDLKMLWSTGVETYDSYRKQNFIMQAMLMWTITDFPGYGMVAGWSTHGQLSCPYCMEMTQSFYLENGRKPCFFYCHRQFLPESHCFRFDQSNFLKGQVELGSPPPRLDGVSMCHRVENLLDVLFGKPFENQTIEGFGNIHNWVKMFIFWELPYWHDNLIRHNLDVMHCEKNFFNNIIHTVMNDNKTKDNGKARLDLAIYCDRRKLHMGYNTHGKLVKPNANYALIYEKQKLLCAWLKQLRFPDGFASNISRCVNLNESRLFGMKSHDCHVFMQRLIPVAFRGLLPSATWGPLTDISNFFRSLCSPVIKVTEMQKWEAKIVEIICKLEIIFPPAFFDSMEHLAIHLSYEAKVGGPVQFRWMYPFERRMHKLKSTIGNKNHVEASIVEAFILYEISHFCSRYFGDDVETSWNQPPRNYGGIGTNVPGKLSVVGSPGESIGAHSHTQCLTLEEKDAAELYVLLNCKEVDVWVTKFEEEVGANLSHEQLQRLRTNNFVQWFKNMVFSGQYKINEQLIHLAVGPIFEVNVYNGFYVNGFKFLTEEFTSTRKTYNCGVCVKGTTINSADETDYYSVLKEVIELLYYGHSGHQETIILFNCDWYDTNRGIRVNVEHRIVDVNPRFKLSTGEQFCLTSQAQQVYYTPYPATTDRTTRGWLAACKIKSRYLIETSSTSSSEEVDDIFQDDDPSIMQGSSLAIDLTAYQSLQLCAEGVTEVEVDANTSEEEEDYREERDSESSRNSDNVEDGDDNDDSDD